MFSILIHRKALKEINGFPTEDKRRILSAIRQIATDPFSGDVKPIKGVKGLLRRRVGEYRIAFTVNFEKSEVVILRVGRREKFYQDEP
jgi:mRNA interferase RelE/StbE